MSLTFHLQAFASRISLNELVMGLASIFAHRFSEELAVRLNNGKRNICLMFIKPAFRLLL
jgi:hypothetical protein